MSQICPRCRHALDLPAPAAFCPFCGQGLQATLALDPGRTTASEGAAVIEIPPSLGPYRLLRRLGQGGMGVVYEGEHATTGRRVAVKLIDVEASGDAMDRFRQEGQLASALSHPRCVFVHAADEDAGRPYLVLELMPGRTLDDEVRERGPLPVAEALGHVLDAIEGLEQVHALGVIHRDVKPSNLFLDADGRVKVGDFGLARLLHADARLTRTGTFVGTPLFAPPEQIKGQPLDVRADVYAVCATLYYLLAGRAPHDGGDRDSLAVLARVVSEDPPAARSVQASIPAGLSRLLARGLSRDRERRPPDLAALREELAAFRPAPPDGLLVGARVAAYLLDSLLLVPVFWVVALLRGHNPFVDLPDVANRLVSTLLWVAYFVVMEGAFGLTVGKWLFGLRVRPAGDTGAPGPWRGLARGVIWFSMISFPSLLVMLWMQPTRETMPLLGVSQGAIALAGMLTIVSTMRKANGYAGLHDLLSGTRVVALPAHEAAVRYPSRPAGHAAEAGDARVGPYRVIAEESRVGEERVLRAIEPSLDRAVWLWVRPADRPEVPPARREFHHGRPRWLSQGEQDGERWDAFLVPGGAPLVEAMAAVGPRPWDHARSVLLDLANARPDRCHPSQVWLSPGGRVILIDLPLAGQAMSAEDVLAEAAFVVLEGRPAAAGRTSPPRGRLPTHARTLVLGLPRFGGTRTAEEFRAGLAAAMDRPARVSRPARLLHLGILLAIQSMCCANIALSPLLFTSVAQQADLDTRSFIGRRFLAAHDRHAAALAAGVVLPGRTWDRLLPAATLVQHGKPRAGLERALDGLDPLAEARKARLYAMMREALAEARKRQVSKEPRPLKMDVWGRENKFELDFQRRWIEDIPKSWLRHVPWLVGVACLPALACMLSVLSTRRGVRSMLVGFDVVRSDGAPAGRLRCIWRACAAWLPLVAVAGVARWLEESYWDQWPAGSPWMLSLADVCWVGCFIVPLLLLLLILLSPSRALHDRLAGTWLVPR